MQITIPLGAYELEGLNYETKSFILEAGHFHANHYSFTIKLIFSTLGSVIKIFRQEPLKSSTPEDSIRVLLGFNASTLYDKFRLSSI